MPRCPQCNKDLVELPRKCPSCKADLDMLVDFVSNLHGRLEQADNLTRAGELGQAMWAYLEVLEVDPGNPAARRQVSQVATAVRAFDAVGPTRRWVSGLPGYTRSGFLPAWLRALLLVVALAAALGLGYLWGAGYLIAEEEETPGEPPQEKPPAGLGLPPKAK